MKVTLMGETPSKKNSRINTRSGRSFPNQRYMKWHNAVVSQLNQLLFAKQIEAFPEGMKVSMTVKFIHGDLVRRDSDNQLSSILDTLVDAKILSDDNWKVIPEKHIYDLFEKNNARCEIEIKPYIEYVFKEC